MRDFSFTPDQRAALVIAAYYFLEHVESHPKRNSLKNALTKLRKSPNAIIHSEENTGGPKRPSRRERANSKILASNG